MIILPAFSMFAVNSYPQKFVLKVRNAVGFCFDTPVLPLNLSVESDRGQINVPRKKIIPLPTTDGQYVFTLDDMFAGDVQSGVFAQIEDLYNDYPRNWYGKKADGTIPITIFHTQDEMAHYKPGENTLPVYLAPSLESVNNPNQRWVLQNMDYDVVEMLVYPTATGHWANFQVYEGFDNAATTGLNKRTLLGSLSYTDNNPLMFTGVLAIQNSPNIALQVRQTSATLSNQRFYWGMRFVSRKMSQKVQGNSIIFGKIAMPGGGAKQTEFIQIPIVNSGAGNIQVMLFNDGANPMLSCYVKRYFLIPTGATAGESTAIIASTTIAGGASVASNFQNIPYVIIAGTPDAVETANLWYWFSIGH